MSKQAPKGRLVGLHIYNDDRGRYIFYNIFDKRAYWINDDTDFKKYSVFQIRLPLAIALGFIIVMLLDKVAFGIITGILVYILMSVYFYVKFIPSLKEVKNFTKPDTSFVDRFTEPMSPLRLLAATIMTFLISVLLVVNAYISNYDKITTILNYVLAVLAFGFAIMFLVAYVKKRQQSK